MRIYHTKKIEPFNFLNDPLNPRNEWHSNARQTKKCNQCRKLPAGYVGDTNINFSKVNKFF